MSCYLCDHPDFVRSDGAVRDAPELEIRECTGCGLVSLSSIDHVGAGHYDESGMHSGAAVPIDSWLRDTQWDDRHRFEMLRPMIVNRRVLDFGCGASGFLIEAQRPAVRGEGIEFKLQVRDCWMCASSPGASSRSTRKSIF